MPPSPISSDPPLLWTWPPPGSFVRGWRVVERSSPSGRPAYLADPDDRPEPLHLRALTWLLQEHPRRGPAPGQEVAFRLEVARSPMPAGRVGHRYALDGAPLGASAADAARGALWRWIHHLLAESP